MNDTDARTLALIADLLREQSDRLTGVTMPAPPAIIVARGRRQRRRARLGAIAACACLIAGAVYGVTTLTGTTSSTAPTARVSPMTAGFVAHKWRVSTISHDGKTIDIAGEGVSLAFSPDGQFLASDGVNALYGTYRATSDGFSTSSLTTTAVGGPTTGLAGRLIGEMFGALAAGDHAAVSQAGGRLVITVASYTLNCDRPTPQPVIPGPVQT